MYKYIATNRLSGPRNEIEDILETLKTALKEKYGLQSFILVTGSVRRNLVAIDEQGHFDLDYNICFIKVPQNVRNNLHGLKSRIMSQLDAITYGNYEHAQDSTSVITLERADEEYSLDLGILIRNKKNRYCRLIRDSKTGKYLLQEVSFLYNTESQEEYIQRHHGWKRVEDLYLRTKNRHPDRDSFHVYLETVNTVFNELGGQQMSKVSGNTHTKGQMDAHANQKNPNNAASKAAANNRSNQMNPNNAAYKKSRSGK